MTGPLAKLSNTAALVSRAPDVIAALGAMTSRSVLPVEEHLVLCAEGLLNASRHSTDGGYSVCYSLIHGWHHGYVETTGYIVPTALDLARRLDREALREDALAQGRWLLAHQKPDGSFPCVSRAKSMAFDTGQVLMGLQRLYLETGDQAYLDAGARAAEWLVSIQDADGAWTRSGDPAGRSVTFLTRSAAALADFGALAGEPRYAESAARFLDWAAAQRLPSGLFRRSELVAGDPYLLHTMIYVLEGFLHAWRVTGERRWLDCAREGAEPLKRVNLERDHLLYSYYDAELRPRSRQRCITGLSQWAGVALALHAETGDADYLECASISLFFVMRNQLKVRGHLRGALPGSSPLWGDYLKWAFPNWNLKFFADALLRFEGAGVTPDEQRDMFDRRARLLQRR